MSASPSTNRRVLPRMAAAATVTAALVAGGAATGNLRASSTVDVQAIINAWPKKYTGVGLVVEPPADTVAEA
jgi:hypothetical protein